MGDGGWGMGDGETMSFILYPFPTPTPAPAASLSPISERSASEFESRSYPVWTPLECPHDGA
jgi:hypothetical protein